ncbi:uncharacterized protein RVIR1_12040 [Candidatus Rickettsiella viridis]|uniref:Lipoprotein n=1 Tax=Candidatus Rickettsiella viridis TaxID=676208 RepID=A0A2Z5UVL8_9COXI|nr:hypothetical protein [Candidatus Rickettsiella viridis]BBB15666.1 uncharacterized protein RVIR1_12040 [Candidatus Rickettsiella viridis]
MKKILASLVITTLLLSACAGKTPNPIPQHQPGDELLTCSQIKQELLDNRVKVMNLIPKENKMGKNIALGVAGAFVIVPWFFMDFSDAERVEIQGYQLRDNWLRSLSIKKKCGALPASIRFQGQ